MFRGHVQPARRSENYPINRMMVMLWFSLLFVIVSCCVPGTHADEARAEDHTNNITVREGLNATFTWNLKMYGHRFYIRSPMDKSVLTVESSQVSIWYRYRSRVKIVNITNSSLGLRLQFTMYNVTASDAGRYTCSTVWWSGGTTFPDCGYTMFVEGTRNQTNTTFATVGQDTALVYTTPFRTVPEEHPQIMPRTGNNTHLHNGKGTEATLPHSSRAWITSSGCPVVKDLLILTLFVIAVIQ
ncbi:uncharacterized protein LOC124286919 [Haliotis rubra]|uniref:uncharacterized protein LOC124286919 n=1 Tax=Haliotis rubra TaxID=36100 RepID=UPI001EE51EB3|nr:uncharacterized protein LOC124286919 [Haliotis rubra]